MSGNSVFADTNILLYLLAGDETISELLDGKNIVISFITELELLGFKELASTEALKIKELIQDATIVDINSAIKNHVIELRKQYKIKLPDAIIAASALYYNLPLLSADKQLGRISQINLILYEK